MFICIYILLIIPSTYKVFTCRELCIPARADFLEHSMYFSLITMAVEQVENI